MGIDTGKFILQLKQRPNTFINSIWANNFNLFIQFNCKLLSLANWVSAVLGKPKMYKISSSMHQTIPIIPIYPNTMPQTQISNFTNSAKLGTKQIMYIPSCNNRIFADSDISNSFNAVHNLLEYLGYSVIYPEELTGICCGQIFDSAGNPALGLDKKSRLGMIIQNSPHSVLIDNSSCFYTMSMSETTNNNQIVSIIDIIEANLPQLNIKTKYAKLALHIDCCSKKLGQKEQIIRILSYFADEIIIPHDIDCCGFAGTKGFTTPELNKVALSTLSGQISQCDIGVTFNRNCQIGLSLHGGKKYVSLAELILNAVT